jgi:hypothetical protein
MCLLNSKEPTFIHPETGSRSFLDLSFSDPSMYLDYTWRVLDYLCGSDQFPILIQHTVATPIPEAQRWKLDRAEWDSFKDLCSTERIAEDVLKAENPIESFTNTILSAAEQSIPKTSKEPRIL